jgi:carbon storage regulator
VLVNVLEARRTAMLVLSRKPGESIVIAGNIRVTVVEVRAGKVRIGVEAPKEVSVDRSEVYEAKQEAHGTEQSGNPPPAKTDEKPKRRKPRKPRLG